MCDDRTFRYTLKDVGRGVAGTLRIVQEGLTNARKHAAGAPVDLVLAGTPGAGLTVDLTNRPGPAATHDLLPGAGSGLIGLSERAALASGRLEHGFTDAGDFRLHA